MANNSKEDNIDLLDAETGIRNCTNFSNCGQGSKDKLTLSNIEPGSQRRGSRDPKVMIITEAPDLSSSQGTPYAGSLSSRIIRLFCNEKYGISLPELDQATFQEFLLKYRFYATSAVKCHAETGGKEIGDYTIRECHNRYLRKQINAMPNLELIIPMGQVAASSTTRNPISSVRITSLIGKLNVGIFPNHREFDKRLVILPHPSGVNPYANPPIIGAKDDRRDWGYKIRFREALEFIRKTLNQLGYDVPTKSPSSWDLPPGLSGFK